MLHSSTMFFHLLGGTTPDVPDKTPGASFLPQTYTVWTMLDHLAEGAKQLGPAQGDSIWLLPH